MKHLLLTTIAAVVLVGCGESQQSAPPAETKPDEPAADAAKPEGQPEPTTPKAPDISIHDAAKAGDIETVKQHLAAGTEMDVKGKDGWTSLHFALQLDHKEIVELLIANGADVNAKAEDGVAPLHVAAGGGHKEVAELLIANGADVNAKVVSGAAQGKTPLDAANETNHPKMADLLRKHGGKTKKELEAAAK